MLLASFFYRTENLRIDDVSAEPAGQEMWQITDL